MYRRVATRHITGSPGAYEMLHDKLSGRITSHGKGGVVLVVDGMGFGIENLVSMLLTHEGWEFGSLNRRFWAPSSDARAARRPPNLTFERTAGWHSLAAAAQRARWASKMQRARKA